MSWLGLVDANKVDITPGNHIATPLVTSWNVVIMSDGMQQGTEAVDHLGFSGRDLDIGSLPMIQR